MLFLLLFHSRKLWKIAQGLSEEAQCIQGAIMFGFQTARGQWLLCSTLSGRRISSSHQCVNLVYLCWLCCLAKFGALIEGSTKSGQVKTGQGYFLRYSLPDSLFCLLTGCLTDSDLSPRLNRSSRTIMDISQHVSSVFNASWPRAIKRPQHHTLDRKFH